MAKRKSRKSRRGFWGGVIAGSVVAAAAILITINGYMDRPFLPTWDTLFSMAGLTEPVPLDGELQVHAIDVGNADALLIRTGGQAMLIDAGENADGAAVVNYLQRQGVKRLDLVIATHPDADHIGGMDDVVRALDIGTLVMAFMPEGYTPTTKTYMNLLESVADKGLKITPAVPGGTYTLGDARVDILGPAGEFTETNNQSVVCKVTYGSRRFLFMGDAEKEAENALLASGADLAADVIKLGHHGSNSSSQKTLLKAVSPAFALITCGEDNSYNHPSPKVIDRLQSLHITVYRCDLNGTIVLTTDGVSIHVETEKGNPAAPSAAA